MDNRMAIEVSAQGNFGNLLGQLKQLQNGLNGVVKTVNTPQRQGGFFNGNGQWGGNPYQRTIYNSGVGNSTVNTRGNVKVSITSIDSTVLSQITKAIQSGFQQQNSAIVQETIQRYRDMQQKIDNASNKSAGNSSTGSSGSSNRRYVGKGANKGGGNPLSGLSGGLKGLLGLAGIGFGISELMKMEQMAESANISWQPLLQRTGMNRSTMEGMGLQYGYNTQQTRGVLDAYTQLGGNISSGQFGNLLAFSRGYGVDPNTAAALTGQYAQLGYGAPSTVLNNIAGSAQSSGMVPRILEVMESGLAYLKSMDTSLKDNSGNSLLAYTTRLNQIGNQDGYAKLTGQSGADIMSQMAGNIFSPGNTTWQSIGMNALRKYGGNATKNMSAMQLMYTWQQGLDNPANINALSGWLNDPNQGGGLVSASDMPYLRAMILQNAMGGNTPLPKAMDLGKATGWLSKLSSSDSNMSSMQAGGNAAGNTQGVGAASELLSQSNAWKVTMDASIEISNAKLYNAQVQAGNLLIPTKLAIQDFTSDVLNALTGVFQQAGTILDGIIAAAVLRGFLKGFKNVQTVPTTTPPTPPITTQTPTPSTPNTTLDGPGGGWLSGILRGTTYAILGHQIQVAQTNGWTDISGMQHGPMNNALFKGLTGSQTNDYMRMKGQGTLPAGVHSMSDYYKYLQTSPGGTSQWAQALNTQGQQDLQKLQTDGLVKLGQLQDDGTRQITALNQQGTKALADLQSKGEVHLTSMDRTTSDKLTSMAQTHTTSMNSMSSSFDNFVQSAENFFTGKGWNTNAQLAQQQAQAAIGTNAMPGGNAVTSLSVAQVQSQVQSELAKQGLGNWWPLAKQVLNRETSGGVNEPGAPDPKDGTIPYGIFQIKQGTWDHNMGKPYAGQNPMDFSVPIQTDAFIRYIKSSYGDIFNMAQKTGLGTDSYVGYATGTFVNHDKVARVHSGEEILSRTKTAETLRKTGKLPSQVLSDVLNGGTMAGGSAPASGRVTVTHKVHLTSDGSIPGLQVAQMQQIAQEVFDAGNYQAQKGNPYF